MGSDSANTVEREGQDQFYRHICDNVPEVLCGPRREVGQVCIERAADEDNPVYSQMVEMVGVEKEIELRSYTARPCCQNRRIPFVIDWVPTRLAKKRMDHGKAEPWRFSRQESGRGATLLPCNQSLR